MEIAYLGWVDCRWFRRGFRWPLVCDYNSTSRLSDARLLYCSETVLTLFHSEPGERGTPRDPHTIAAALRWPRQLPPGPEERT